MLTKPRNCPAGENTRLFHAAFAVAVCLVVQVFCEPVHAQHQPAGRQLVPILEEVFAPVTPGNPRNDHAAILSLSEDRLMMAWTEYYGSGGSDGDPSHIVSKISTDKGRTWGTYRVLQENIWAENVKQPNLVRLPSDEILFFFRGWDSNSRAAVYMKRSMDEAQTWSNMVQISDPGVFWNNADRAITLSTGRVILPAHGVVGGGPYLGTSSLLESFVYYSDDGFQTWYKGQAMTAPGRGAHEPSIVELSDGRLLSFMRTNQGRVYQAFSTNHGVSWSVPEPTVLYAPGSPPKLTRIPQTGDLLAIWNNVEFPSGNLPRTPLTAAISQDEGETWIKYQDIVVPPDTGSYTSVFFQDNEAIVMSSTQPYVRELVERIYEIDEFYVAVEPPPPPTSGTPIRDETGNHHAVATGGGVTWQGDGAGELFGAAVPNPDPIDTSTNGTLNAGGVNTRSLFFDSSADCLTIADNDAFDFSGAFTIEGYFRATNTDDIDSLLNKRNNPGDTIGYKVFLKPGGIMTFGVDNGPTWGRVGFDDYALNDDAWHHFAAIRDAGDGLHIWVDGVEDLTPETNGATTVSGDLRTDAPLLIGYDGTLAERSMDGYIDELRFSDVALSSALFLLNDAVYCVGDANRDETVDDFDAAILAANWQATGASWGHGDFNDDGIVNDIDAAILASHWRQGVGEAAPAPEPASCVMIVVGLLTILLLRRTRTRK